ncbi:MAG: response regulator transcription factor [Bdellovibrionaceae bacterium]|nr:response regulator transcription factor [Pseudobdellovibrionaceae bacterium]
MPTVFVIEDEEDIAELIKYNLTLEGYNVEVFHTGEAGLKALEARTPDLLLLDLMLPGVDGLEICRRVKDSSFKRQVPIIMVTAKGEEKDVVLGLELGADDYVSKPFSPKVLMARVRAVIRRDKFTPVNDDSVIERAGLFLHKGRHELKINGQLVDLTNSEFQIIYFLAKRPGWVFTRTQIVDAIHGDNYAVTDRSIDFQMVGLRKKLGSIGHLIETVRGVGYRFKELD